MLLQALTSSSSLNGIDVLIRKYLIKQKRIISVSFSKKFNFFNQNTLVRVGLFLIHQF